MHLMLPGQKYYGISSRQHQIHGLRRVRKEGRSFACLDIFSSAIVSDNCELKEILAVAQCTVRMLEFVGVNVRK